MHQLFNELIFFLYLRLDTLFDYYYKEKVVYMSYLYYIQDSSLI